MAKAKGGRGRTQDHEDRGPVKLQPKLRPTRLRRGDDDLLDAAVKKKAAEKKAAARKVSSRKKKTARKPAKRQR